MNSSCWSPPIYTTSPLVPASSQEPVRSQPAPKLVSSRCWALDLKAAVAAERRARALVLLAEGQADGAAALARQAAQDASEGGPVIEAARSQLAAGRALAAAGDVDRAVHELRLARTELGRCGAARLAQVTGRELRALGAAAPAPVARRAGESGTTLLSTREREVATLVCSG